MFAKIFLISKREYLSKIRKKSFVVMTLLGPLIMVLFYGIVFYFTINQGLNTEQKKILVVQQPNTQLEELQSTDNFIFSYLNINQTLADSLVLNGYYDGLLNIETKNTQTQVTFISKEQPSMFVTNNLEDKLNQLLKSRLFKNAGLNQETLNLINKSKVAFATKILSKNTSKEASAEINSIVGYLGAILIYMFILLYGVQIMRGVIEEKTNRIVEVIITSVKPFELMMGKILGVALVGLTQFLAWVLLTLLLGGQATIIINQFFADSLPQVSNTMQQGQMADGGILAALFNLNFSYLILTFLFYFICGYLFYAALFAAIGSAVDSETDSQQFMFPITMPLILGLVLAQSAVITNPNGSMAMWLSFIPFTSPVVMMVRMPFDVPIWQQIVSMVCLVIGFVFTTWFASRVYKIGILLYGNKPSYKKIIQWFVKGH